MLLWDLNGDEITDIGAHNHISDTFQTLSRDKGYFFNLDEPDR